MGPQKSADPLIEGAHLGLIHGVVQGQHGRAMGGRFKTGSGNWSADFLCGGIRPQEFGVLGLKVPEFPQKGVVFRVRDFRAVLPVVEGIVPGDLTDQAVYTVLGFFEFRICQICVFTVKSLLKPPLR